MGIAPTHRSFADSCLTTWRHGRILLKYHKTKKNIFKFFILTTFNQKEFFDYFLFPEKQILFLFGEAILLLRQKRHHNPVP